MKKLKRFWRALEEPYGVRGVREHWRRYVGAELEAISPFLRSLKEPSLTYPCPRIGGDGCPRGVVVHGPEDIVAVCRTHPKECDTIKLSPADIVEYEFDWKRFCGFLSELLGMVVVAEPLRGQSDTWHVGTWAVNATDHRPAFFVAAASRASFDGAVGVLLISCQGPSIVLAPTLRFSGGAATEGLRQRGAALLALEDVVLQSDEGKLVSAGTLPEMLGAGASPDPAAAVGAHRNVFRREQDFWIMAFQGKAVRLRHIVGFDYLAELLRQPGAEVEALSLAGRAEPEAEAVVVSAGLEVADEKTLREVRSALSIRRSELAAIPAKDWPTRGRLQEEIAKLEGYLSQAEARNGRARRTGGSAQRARTAVTNAIVRAIQNIEKEHKDLGAYLQASVRTGTTLLYLPAKPADWQF